MLGLGAVGLLVVIAVVLFWVDPLGLRAAMEGEKPPRTEVEQKEDSGVRLVAAPPFATLDKNADRRLTPAELRGLPFFGPQDVVEVNFAELDRNGDGRIDPKEYAAYVKKWWNRISVPQDVEKALGIVGPKGLALATLEAPTASRPLTMPGSTDFDPTRVSRVRARFQAEVVELGPLLQGSAPSALPLPARHCGTRSVRETTSRRATCWQLSGASTSAPGRVIWSMPWCN